jgi:hypothetical protein
MDSLCFAIEHFFRKFEQSLKYLLKIFEAGTIIAKDDA